MFSSSNSGTLRPACGNLARVFVYAALVNFGFRQGVAAVTRAILFSGLLLVYRFVGFPLWLCRDFRRHPNFSRQQTLRVDEDGLYKRSEVGQSETKWFAYTRFRETQNLFVLYLGERQAEVVPKRALSNAQLDELRQLLRKKIPGNVKTSELRSSSVSLA
jgi:YcxB-like protein